MVRPIRASRRRTLARCLNGILSPLFASIVALGRFGGFWGAFSPGMELSMINSSSSIEIPVSASSLSTLGSLAVGISARRNFRIRAGGRSLAGGGLGSGSSSSSSSSGGSGSRSNMNRPPRRAMGNGPQLPPQDDPQLNAQVEATYGPHSSPTMPVPVTVTSLTALTFTSALPATVNVSCCRV